MNLPDVHIKMNYYGKLIDFSENHYPVRHYGLATYLTARAGSGKVSNYSMFFNGTSGQYAECACGYKTTPFSVACWIRKNQHGPGSYHIPWSFNLPYLGCGDTSNPDDPFRLSFKDSGGTQRNVSGTTSPAISTWYHVVAILDTDHVELWVDGVREANDATYVPASQTNYAFFDIGRHYASNTYRMHGHIDDLRIYDYALTGDEIQDIINIADDADATRVKMISTGDLVVQGMDEAIDEQDVEWTLVDAFMGGTAVDPYQAKQWDADDSLSGQTGINSGGELTAAGYTYYLTTFNHGSYTEVPGFLQAYYGGSPNGYIQKAIDATEWDYLRIRWGNWYPGSALLLVSSNGGSTWSVIKTLTANYGESIDVVYISPYGSNFVFKVYEAGIFWISEVWLGKNKTSPAKIQYKNAINQDIQIIPNGLSQNLTPFDIWNTSLNVWGGVSPFTENANGSYENKRYRSLPDPWFNMRPVWAGYAGSGSVGNQDGGWNQELFDIDPDEVYRFSVWLQQRSTDGRRYFGTGGYGATNGLYRRDTGALSTNPYFWYGDLPVNDVWYLFVAHVWPRGSGTGSNKSQTGVYTIHGTASGFSMVDWVWHNDTTQSRHRSYQFYCSATGTRTLFAYPMTEKCDGTEVPLEDLISGKAYEKPFKPPQDAYSLGSVTQRMVDSELIIAGETRFK